MPPDAFLPEGPAAELWEDHATSPAADLREAVLKREVARLTRERNRLLTAGVTPPSTLLANPLQPASYGARLAAKDDTIRALYASRSWRFSAPLRLLSRLVGRPAAPDVERTIALTDAVIASEDLPLTASIVRSRPEGRSRGEVLVVAPHLPLFDRQSGGLRLKTLIGLISAMGWTVTFAATTPAESGPGVLGAAAGRAHYEQALRASGVARFVYGMDGIRSLLVTAGGSMRYAFLSFPDVAIAVTPLIRMHCPWARVIFDTVDLHFLRLEREAALHGDPAARRQAGAVRQVELACLRSADVTLTVSEDERRVLLDLVPDAVVETLPNVFAVPPGPLPGPEARDGLLFVGGFWHAPNGDAMLWFADAVWPRIRARLPHAMLRIAGSDPTSEVLALGLLPGIEVLGHVADLTPLYDAARVFVAPLRFGAGMKGKVGQSLVNGLPVVATGIGAEGMGLEDGEHLLAADTAESFAERVITLWQDEVLWRRLQSRGRAKIEETLSEAVVARRLETLLHV